LQVQAVPQVQPDPHLHPPVHPQFEPGILKKCLVGWLVVWKIGGLCCSIGRVCVSELMSRTKRGRVQASIYPPARLVRLTRLPSALLAQLSIQFQTRCLHRTMTNLLCFDWFARFVRTVRCGVARDVRSSRRLLETGFSWKSGVSALCGSCQAGTSRSGFGKCDTFGRRFASYTSFCEFRHMLNSHHVLYYRQTVTRLFRP
jgi:hypothetical protein